MVTILNSKISSRGFGIEVKGSDLSLTQTLIEAFMVFMVDQSGLSIRFSVLVLRFTFQPNYSEIDRSRPVTPRSRLPSASMDLLTEPEISSIKQRTMSQHSILTHQEDLEDQRCPPMFYVWTNRLLIWDCNPVWNRFQSLCHIVCEGTDNLIISNSIVMSDCPGIWDKRDPPQLSQL